MHLAAGTDTRDAAVYSTPTNFGFVAHKLAWWPGALDDEYQNETVRRTMAY